MHYEPELLLRTCEEDILATERICLEGMKKKLTLLEIADRVSEYKKSVGDSGGSAGGGGLVEEAERVEDRPSGLNGVFRYLQTKYPDLEMPH